MFWSELAHSRGPGATRRYVVAQEGRPDRRVRGASPPRGDDGAPRRTSRPSPSARDHWGTGLGSRLLTELLRAATAFECAEVMLECRIDNVRAQKLYERFGFEVIGSQARLLPAGQRGRAGHALTDPSASVTRATP
ncbi:hypothetical protein GCM10019016_069120 [Streptomyces prasinosporus]|uniref:N-acetyltransferase domain-containing protein n=1 Tax=Streptomyces prasinosporus TaxID=68256 RepID=A0ABP6TYH4_9ACTN